MKVAATPGIRLVAKLFAELLARASTLEECRAAARAAEPELQVATSVSAAVSANRFPW